MREMTRDEWWRFASEGTRTGKVGVVRADGSPHVTPVWFVLSEGPDGDEIIFNTGAESVKGRALGREPRLSMTVDDQTPPYSYVHFTAEARISEDLNEMLPWSIRIGSRYMGEDQGELFGKRNAVPGEYLVRAKITKVVAHADMAD
ncbi:PPOX class F420-dependent oxidoreductase [Prauserella muralis]|uniref:PPOX class F420-dependent enzyme n=1 Tax=Prauserella muralis TaxID=588067 RepID=A0A2V4AGX7_9PSEU|nr:PPOX class F420-dependent oxidoreductase [Prauserella muralis]PXY19158.1 PPOX class F420-dependent enzyme [Prauserella muralis]TWE29070.1 PPOX class probable F420-dependent enzyme [Prauserella muralis]